MKLLYGTGNPAKLDAMRHRLAGLGIELIGLKDLGGVTVSYTHLDVYKRQ